MTVELGPEDRRQLAAIEASVSSGTPRPITFDQLARRWEGFVEEVEEGYRDSVDDYTNDLTTRDLLDRIVKGAPAQLASKLRTQLDPIDRRFKQATREDDQKLIGRFIKHAGDWWWLRIPLKLDGTLAATLKA